MTRTRDNTVDLLRTVALILILTAHCWFGDVYENLREFDVVLMFFLSGISFGLSGFTFNRENYREYIVKRFRKLILPVWLFLVVFFVFFRFIPTYDFSVPVMIKSFALTAGGIMFVWVYRVFFVASLTTPLLDAVFQKTRPALIIGAGILCLALNDLLYSRVFIGIGNETIADLCTYLVSYTIGYGIITYFGTMFVRMKESERKLFSILMLVLFAGYAMYYGFPSFEQYKFPPQLCYIAYGLLWSSVLYQLFRNVHTIHPLIRWISVNCMTIYLGHILVFYLVHPFIHNQLLMFAVLMVGSCIFAYIVNGGKKILQNR